MNCVSFDLVYSKRQTKHEDDIWEQQTDESQRSGRDDNRLKPLGAERLRDAISKFPMQNLPRNRNAVYAVCVEMQRRKKRRP